MREIDIVFNSEKESADKLFQIASGFISETTVLFEKENVIAVIQAKGQAAFYNIEDELLDAGEVPPLQGGKGVYQDVGCRVEKKVIVLQFPLYEWIDHYPHCDGEHDRWETRIIGYHTLKFDTTINKVL